MNWKFWQKNKTEVKPVIKKSEFSTDALDCIDGVDMTQARADYIENNAIQRKAPEAKAVEGAAMDGCEGASAQYQANFEHANPHLLSYFIASSSFIGYHAMAIIAQHWLVSKGCEMKAKDAVKKGWDISVNDGTDLDAKQIKVIEALDKKYRLKYNMSEGVKFKNIFGIRHLLFKNTDPNFDYEKPFNPDSFKDGKYAGISQIDPYWLTPVFDNNDLMDPSSIGFYEPTYWLVSSKKYHKSHFVILLGDEVSDYLKPTYRYGGVSLAQKVHERVYASERTANEAPQLAMTKRLQVRKTDLAKAQANKAAFVKKLQTASEFRDNYGVTVVGKDEDIVQLETSLADLDDVIMTQFQLVSAVFDIPAIKMLNTTPKGFSGGSEENDIYLESVEELQGNDMNEIAQAHYARLIPSELSKALSINDLEIELAWRPLKIMSDKEQAEANASKATADGAYFQTGAIDSIDIRDRLINDKNSGYSGMSQPSEIIEPDE